MTGARLIRRRCVLTISSAMLLIATFAIWMANQVESARAQRDLVEAVKRSGGWAHYEHNHVGGKFRPGGQPWAPDWVRDWLGDDYFQTLTCINLVHDESTGEFSYRTDAAACDDVFARINGAPRLRRLVLQREQVRDEMLKVVGGLTTLEELELLDAGGLTDAGVAHLRSLRNLRRLTIHAPRVSDLGLARLRSLERLQTLSLETEMTDAALDSLGRLTQLKELLLPSDSNVDDAGLASLATLTRLELLEMSGSKVTDKGLEHLGKLRALRTIGLNRTQITDRGLKSLETLPALRTILRAETRVTRAGMESFRAARPDVSIE